MEKEAREHERYEKECAAAVQKSQSAQKGEAVVHDVEYRLSESDDESVVGRRTSRRLRQRAGMKRRHQDMVSDSEESDQDSDSSASEGKPL